MKFSTILIGILSVIFVIDSAVAPLLGISFFYLLALYLIAITEILALSTLIKKVRHWLMKRT